MELEYYLWLATIAILHWVGVIMLLKDLTERKRAFGGKKWPWALLIILLTIVGGVIYIIFHPGVLIERKDGDEDDDRF